MKSCKEVALDFEYPNLKIGNNLFLFAAGYAYARKHNAVLTAASNSFISKLIPEVGPMSSGKTWHKIGTSLGQNDDYFSAKQYVVNRSKINVHGMLPAPSNDYMMISGTYETYNTFKDCADEIRGILRPPVTYLNAYGKKYEEYVGVGVRRGDKLNWPKYFYLPGMEYYKNCMSKFPEGTKFLIFSDDDAWCKEEFSKLPFECEYASDATPLDQFFLGQMCKRGFICASSTFSWWQAFLSGARQVYCCNLYMPDNKITGDIYGTWNQTLPPGFITAASADFVMS